MSNDPQHEQSEFERAGREAAPGFFAEFFEFLRDNKKWWLLPIVVIMIALGALVLLSGTPLMPFVYTIF